MMLIELSFARCTASTVFSPSNLMQIYPIRIAIPAVMTRIIGSSYVCMITHAKAVVMQIVEIRITVLAQWLTVKPFDQ